MPIDRYTQYETMIKKYGKDINLDDNFEVIEVKRGDEDISATAVRQALRNNDEDTYISLVPNTWRRQFVFLRDIIMGVDEDVVVGGGRMISLYEYLRY